MATNRIFSLLAITVASLCGCASSNHIRDAEYAQVTNAIHEAAYPTLDLPTATSDFVTPIVQALEGPHAVQDYIRFALDQNPEIQAARKQIEAQAHRVPVAGSLSDPMLGSTVFPGPVQTAAGQQELALTANQKLPWFGKLETRAGVAEAQTNVARAQLAAVELATVARVKQAYYELYFIQKAIAITKTDQKSLGDIRDVANARYKTNKVTQQDLLRAELEIANVERELIRLRQQMESAQARLGRILHISPETKMLALEELPPANIPQDVAWLQRRAVEARPELHARLAALARDRQSIDLARLDYMPDVTLGATWIDVASAGISPVANGRDSFLITAGINLPIYRKRLDASVRSAEAKAVATARQYDSLKDMTLEQVVDLFAQIRSQQDLLTLFREDILPKARLTLEVSSRAYNAGQVDFLQLIDNWRQLLRYQIAYRRLEATIRQKIADMERLVGGFGVAPGEEIPRPQR